MKNDRPIRMISYGWVFCVLVLLNMCIVNSPIYLTCNHEYWKSGCRICPSYFDMKIFKTKSIL